MFSSPIAVLAACVVAVSAAPSLSVKTSTPNIDVDGLENLKVTTTVVNTGGEVLKLFSDPRGVLGPSPANTFNITNSSGSHPTLTGTRVQGNPARAIESGGPIDFTVLAPGDSINVTHNLSASYDFTQSGPGDYSIEPSGLFTHVDADGTPQDFHATVESIANVRLSGDLSVSRPAPEKRATYIHCRPSERKILKQAALKAQRIVAETYDYIKGAPRGAQRYVYWFGRWSAKRNSTVHGIFEKLNNARLSTLTFDCTSTCPMLDRDLVVDRYTPGLVWICKGYWEIEPEYHSLMFIHETTHYSTIGPTEDHVYGRDKSHEYALDDPDKAVNNADNYMFFAENMYNME